MIIKISFKPVFVKQMNKLEKELTTEAFEKIGLFRNTEDHKTLKVHKLHGKMLGRFSFSVNYKFRIVFRYVSKDEVVFLDIGDHDLYR